MIRTQEVLINHSVPELDLHLDLDLDLDLVLDLKGP